MNEHHSQRLFTPILIAGCLILMVSFAIRASFGLFQIPALMAPDKALSEQVLWVHGLAAYILLGLVAIHIAAALYHHFIRGDGVLARMLPSLRRDI